MSKLMSGRTNTSDWTSSGKEAGTSGHGQAIKQTCIICDSKHNHKPNSNCSRKRQINYAHTEALTEYQVRQDQIN